MKPFNNLTVATLGGHSALEIFYGAKKERFKTLAIVQKGREKTYTHYYNHLIDSFITVNHFSELTEKSTSKILKEKKCIVIPHRYFQVYCDLEKIEKQFSIPIYGNKYLLKYEERSGEHTQYELLGEAGIPYPKRISNPKDIKMLVLVKVNEADRAYERCFFFARDYREYRQKVQELIKNGKIIQEDLTKAVIEEYIIGAQVNFNFFYSTLTNKLELLGTDTRRQTNIDGLIRLPAEEQLAISGLSPSYIETGHIAVTVKESLLESAFELAENLIVAAKKIAPPGIIGPFALQCAVLPGPPKETIVVFDLSLRMPGSPGTSFTPYSYYHYGTFMSFGHRIALELRRALTYDMMDKIST